MTSIYAKAYKIATNMIIAGTLMMFVVTGQVVAWSMDREPPFTVVSSVSFPAKAGEVAAIRSVVKRDLDRKCSVTYSRMFIDSKGVAWDLTEGVRLMTASALNELDKRNPDSLVVKVTIPRESSEGIGSLLTVLEYTCNPVHQLYPIPVVMMTDVEVVR